MRNPTRSRVACVLGLVVLAVMLLGCEHQITAYPEQPALATKGANHQQVLVHFEDVASIDDLEVVCYGAHERLTYACASYYPPSDPAYPDRALVIIHTLPPKDFNDVPKLALIGHEALHGRGWKHK